MIQEQKEKLRESATGQAKALIIKAIILIAAVRVSIWFFVTFAAPTLGLGHSHIIIGESIVTIAITLVVISLMRGLLKRTATKIQSNLIASISFFSIIIISLISLLVLLYIWGVELQTILVGGGVAAIIVGFGISTIVGNLFSGALMLTTYPAKIGDSVYVTIDNIHGTIRDINTLYTKIKTDRGTEYLVPNSAILQGNIRIIKEEPLRTLIPYGEGDRIDISNDSQTLSGKVIKITSRSTILFDGDKEVIVSNRFVLDDKTIIKKQINEK